MKKYPALSALISEDKTIKYVFLSLFIFVGNPKRGRQSSSDPAKPSPLPEPVVYFQYQDRSYMSEEVINLDALLDAFEDNLPDTIKVKKEDLKKILEKNTENMGRPLEKRKAYIQVRPNKKYLCLV